MSSLFLRRISNTAPPGYVTPPWPSLYWPLPVHAQQSYYIYDVQDAWRFTLIWTLLFFGAVHLATSLYAVTIQWRNWKVIWITPLLYCIVGGTEAIIAGSITGALLGGIYQSGTFRMSTWIPFVWGLINTLVLILSSFAIQGGL